MIGQFVNYKFFHLEASERLETEKSPDSCWCLKYSGPVSANKFLGPSSRGFFIMEKRQLCFENWIGSSLEQELPSLGLSESTVFSYHLFIISCLFMSYHLFVSNHASCMLHRNNVVEYLFLFLFLFRVNVNCR